MATAEIAPHEPLTVQLSPEMESQISGRRGQISKSQHAYQWIKERILSGEFPPGYRLVLASIAAETKMSVVPVREAIRQLEAEGPVTFERNVGAYVSMLEPERYAESMETLSVVEAAATSRSAPHLTEEEIGRAHQVNAAMTEVLDDFDPAKFTQLNREFHSILYMKCPNILLRDLVNAEWDRLSGYRDSTFSFVPYRAQESVKEHAHILELIENHATQDEIEHAVREHREGTLTGFLTRTAPQTPHGP